MALRKFLFEGLPVRGAHVRLDAAWRELLARRAPDGEHAYALPVRRLLGEMAAAGCLLQASLKFDGALILQLQGDGPVRLAVAEVQSDLRFRATAKVVGEAADASDLAALVNRDGQGRCAITLDPQGRQPGQQPYQGVVPLQDDRGEPLRTLAGALEHYMRKSEQLDTRFVLAADDAVAAGLMIQRLPQPDDAGEDYQRLALLTATLARAELLALDAEGILRRLYAQDDVRLYAPTEPRFACSCSRERVAAMLRSLGVDEVRAILAERGEVEVGCDFCGAVQRFDAVDVDGLFTPARDQPPAPADLQ